jgi:hypothetical protein
VSLDRLVFVILLLIVVLLLGLRWWLMTWDAEHDGHCFCCAAHLGIGQILAVAAGRRGRKLREGEAAAC